MASDSKVPSLAELRRKRAPRAALTPSLFDALPADPPAAPAPSLTVAPEPELAPPLPKIWSVAELVSQVRGLIERTHARVVVEGEVSNWRPAASGHCYFTLKDGAAQLSIVMFRTQAQRLRFKPKDGDAVRITGQLSVYESRGQMQLIADTMTQVGLGALLAATRELKERLRAEGLFDRKRPLPAFPRCIGIITSLHGAALRDIVKVCRRRHSGVNLLVYPAAVQGPRCAVEVTRALRWFSAHPDRADVILVARGGGSWEDLHGFDDERVARAIVACAVPVISGIGHATDSTIADAAADVCAPTPSAAAELVTAAQHRIEERLATLHARVFRAGRYELLRAKSRFARLGLDMMLRRAQDGLGRRAQRLDELDFRAAAAARHLLRTQQMRLERLDRRLRQHEPAAVTAGNRRRVDALHARLQQAARSAALRSHSRLDRATLQLEAMSPLRVLERGYALVYGPGGELLRAANSVLPGQQVTARLHRGRITATVDKASNNESSN